MTNDYVEAVISVRVPKWQIGEEVQVFFKDSMSIKGECKELMKMKVEECAGHSIEYAMGWKACMEYLKGENDG